MAAPETADGTPAAPASRGRGTLAMPSRPAVWGNGVPPPGSLPKNREEFRARRASRGSRASTEFNAPTKGRQGSNPREGKKTK